MVPTQMEQTQSFQRRFLVLILITLLVTLMIFASPFVIDLFIAGILVTAVYPLHKRIVKKVSFSKSLGALISMLIIILVVLLPFSFFVVFIAQEAGDAYTLISNKINEISQARNGDFSFLEGLPFAENIEAFLKNSPITMEDVLRTFSESVGQVSGFLLGQTTAVLKSLSLFLLHLIVFLMILFYFLRDGDRLVAYLKSLLPLSNVYREELFTKLSQLSYGIIYGLFGAAILQGFLVGIAFWAAGFDNAAFWGAIAALFAPVPFIGPMAVWIPALIILLIGGKWITAILFLLWCMGIVGTADNVIKPYLIGASSALNPMALLIVILGGTFVFGLKGLIFGAFVLTLTLSFLHIYQLEYRAVLENGGAPVIQTIPKKPDEKLKKKKMIAKKD